VSTHWSEQQVSVQSGVVPQAQLVAQPPTEQQTSPAAQAAPPLHEQLLSVHSSPAAHRFPQSPQLKRLADVSKQDFWSPTAQQSLFESHATPPQEQRPATQSGLASTAAQSPSQSPQCAGSSMTFVSQTASVVQLAVPPGH